MPRSLPVLDPSTMPRTRGDCLAGGRNAARPCGWLVCRHNIAAEPGWSGGDSCALDVADQHPGGVTLEEIGQTLGLTRERVRQIEVRVLRQISRARAARDLRDLAAPD